MAPAPRPDSRHRFRDLEGAVVYVPDLGIDEIRGYRPTPAGLELCTTLVMPPGTGPRHMAFHPDGAHAFVVNELSSQVGVLRCRGDDLQLVEMVSTLPESYRGPNSCAAIRVHPAGDFVYASNRGHDSLSLLAFEANRSRLIPFGHIPSGGVKPRDFSLDTPGEWAVVANQHSGNLATFRVRGGVFSASGRGTVLGSPACVLLTGWSR